MHDIEELLRQMTLQEKVAMLAGTHDWYTIPVERLGIPSLKMSDGPNGARGEGGFSAGVRAACFPAGISLASTWNLELVGRVGRALAREAKMKGARVLLAPTVNIQRSPLGGRNFECFSEDPYLTGRLAVAYIQGLQGEGVGASIKHYVCNDEEFERFSINSNVRERPLREVYLLPFQMAVQEAKPWTIMAAYNLVNGVAASEDHSLLTEILRDEWGFDGAVISDWFFSVKSTAASVNAGLDLEMPFPRWRGQKLLKAVELGQVAESTLDTSVRRLLNLLVKADVFENAEEGPEQDLDLPEHRALIREAGAEGIVLLKNAQEALPLQREQLRSIAVIGPQAQVAQIMGGGSAQVNTHHAVTPFEGIEAKVGHSVRVRYEPGCTNFKLLPLLENAQLQAGTNSSESGMLAEFFANSELAGAPVHQETSSQSEFSWFGAMPEGVSPQEFSLRATSRFTPRETGAHTFGLVSVGRSRLLIDGKQVLDNWSSQSYGGEFFSMGSTEVQAAVRLEAGQAYQIVLEFSKGLDVPMGAVHLGCLPPVPTDRIARAAALAADSDVAIVCVGFGGDWQSEGFDRTELELPGEQNALIAQVAAANPRTIVVLNTGSPISMPWLDQVAGVIQAWYPGQECGNAIADVLFGDTNPSGKLPQTYPQRLEDTPTFLDFPGENGQIYYGEGVFVGYRSYDKRKIAPLFPFGFGLSYTTFDYGSLHLDANQLASNESLQLSIDITNTGQRAGKEIAQLYIRDRQASLQRPEKELKAFTKVQLEPGERKTVTFTLEREALAYYDDLKHAWVAEAGEFEVLVGASSQDIRASGIFTLSDTAHWGGPKKPA